MRVGFFRVFRWRYRYIDHVLLLIAPLLLLFWSDGFGIVAIAVFAIGVWLYCGRHRVSRYVDPGLFRAAMAIGLYSLGRWAVDLLNVPTADQIELPYFALLAFLPFVPVGLVLVRDPLGALVKGCRVAIVAAAALGAYHLAIGTERYGFGTNELIAAYFFLIFACLARFRLPGDPAWRPGLWFFYLTLLPIAAASARIVILFFLVAALYDAWRLSIYLYRRQRYALLVGCIVLFGLFCALILSIPQVAHRIDYLLVQMSLVMQGDYGNDTLRIVIWNLGLEQFLQHPIFGTGQSSAVILANEQLAAMDLRTGFRHFHNMALDVLTFSGLVGGGLLVWFCVAAYKSVRGPADSSEWKRNVNVLFIGIGLYGLTGSFISDERMLMLTGLAMGTLAATKKREKFRQARQ